MNNKKKIKRVTKKDNFERMINEKPYDEEVLGELNIYNEVYKQPSRKKCALLPMGSMKKIIDIER